MTVNQRRAEAFRRGNVLVAEIVAGDPVRYPAGSLMAIWASMILHPTSTGRETSKTATANSHPAFGAEMER
jgi:hypothetical protein